MFTVSFQNQQLNFCSFISNRSRFLSMRTHTCQAIVHSDKRFDNQFVSDISYLQYFELTDDIE